MDTALKRASALNVSSPWRGILPLPDGAIGQADRQVVALMYSGILATAAVVASPPAALFTPGARGLFTPAARVTFTPDPPSGD